VRALLTRPIGELLKEWRRRRGRSQLDLALNANISARHLSFIETGRALPSRDMILHLAEQLEVPLRDRNTLLLAGGFAPLFTERSLHDPEMADARHAVELVLAGHEPYPALAVDRHWNLVLSNRAVAPLLRGIAEELLQPPVNVLRIALHPAGLAPRILNFNEWRAQLLSRLRRQLDLTADPHIAELMRELRNYRTGHDIETEHSAAESSVFVPFRFMSDAGPLDFISTTTVFGTPVEITLAELSLETFFPANAATARALRTLASTD
jgi:transcriptional regulator with XRE-family HTH domain